MTEDEAREQVNARSGGVDEILTDRRAIEFSHRWAAGQLGAYRPANGLHLARATHDWLHAHPALAQAGGWHLLSDTDPVAAPVWLPRPWPGWWHLDDTVTDGPHVVLWADEQPPRPRLPFEPARRYAAYRAGLALNAA